MTGTEKPLRIALLDLYEGAENQGMRGIRQIIAEFATDYGQTIELKEFEVRVRQELPDATFDIYISSGGPGSPIDSKHEAWDQKWMKWLYEMETYNANPLHTQKKHIFFICHSFQLACRYYRIADVVRRVSTSFGVFPIHLLNSGENDPVFQGMPDPFYAVDSRDYQVIRPNLARILQTEAKILCIEKSRKHVPYERAIMGIRFTDYFVGTQFHPEADARGMSMYLQRPDKKESIIQNHGREKWESMVEHLEDPDKIFHTYHHILPNFLRTAAGLDKLPKTSFRQKRPGHMEKELAGKAS